MLQVKEVTFVGLRKKWTRGYEVIPTAAPNDVEKAQHYLWRFWTEFPKAGHVTIFDRSWYGRVLVERVEGFCSEQDWKRAYREINEMEENFHHFGTAIVNSGFILTRMNNSIASGHGKKIQENNGSFMKKIGETVRNGSLMKKRSKKCF